MLCPLIAYKPGSPAAKSPYVLSLSFNDIGVSAIGALEFSTFSSLMIFISPLGKVYSS